MTDQERRVRPTPPERRPPVRIVALTTEKVADYIDRILRTATWLTPADFPLVTQAARNLMIADQVWSYFEQRQWIDSRGRPRGAVRQWLALMNTVSRQLNALGLGPVARAELQADVAGTGFDLARLMQMGRQEMARERQGVDHADGPARDVQGGPTALEEPRGDDPEAKQ